MFSKCYWRMRLWYEIYIWNGSMWRDCKRFKSIKSNLASSLSQISNATRRLFSLCIHFLFCFKLKLFLMYYFFFYYYYYYVGMYYLCDAAYTHTGGFMFPYRNTWYWLADFRLVSNVRGKYEIFNRSHARLINVIKIAFGVFKARFRILDNMSSYHFHIQLHIVVTCMATQNFLHRFSLYDKLFEKYEDVVIPDGPSINSYSTKLPHSYDKIFEFKS